MADGVIGSTSFKLKINGDLSFRVLPGSARINGESVEITTATAIKMPANSTKLVVLGTDAPRLADKAEEDELELYRVKSKSATVTKTDLRTIIDS